MERFDRTPENHRRLLISALTMFELDERHAWNGSNWELADIIRARFTKPQQALTELFRRIAFNIAVGNTDDHARNHAAFWDGKELTLTPAYDIDPQPRVRGEAVQAMAYGREGQRFARFSGLVENSNIYLLDRTEAAEIVDRIVGAIQENWLETVAEARLSKWESDQLKGRAFLNPYAFEPTN